MPSKQVLIQPGMSERIDRSQLPIGTPELLQNVRVRQGARFDKRPGVESLGVSGLAAVSVSYGAWVGEMAGAPVVGVQNNLTVSGISPLYARSYRKGADGVWTKLGRHGMVVPERRFTMSVDNASTGKDHTCAVVDGILYVAHADVSTDAFVTYYAIDPAGVVLRMGTLTDSATPRLVYANGVLYLVTREVSSGTDIEIRVLDTVTFSLSSETTFAAALQDATVLLDAAPVVAGSTWVLAYVDTATSIRVRVMSGTTSSVTSQILTTNQATQVGVAAYEGEHVCVAYVDGTALEASVLLLTNLTGGNFSIRTATGGESYRHQCCPIRVAPARFHIVAGGLDSTTYVPSSFLFHVGVNSSGTLFNPAKVFHMQPASRPWTVSTGNGWQTMLWAHNRTGSSGNWALQASHYVLELQPYAATGGGANLAAISYQHVATRGPSVAFMAHQVEAPAISAGRHATVLLWDDPGALAGMDVAVWKNTLATESVSSTHRQVRESGGALYVSGGALYDISDGSNSSESHYAPENGFPYAPELVCTGVQSGGSLTPGVEYSIVGVYRSMDSRGRVHHSAPSTPVKLTPTGVWRTIDVRAATVAATGRIGAVQDPPQLELYAARNGSVHAYATEAGPATASAAEIDSAVSVTDATLDAAPPLYTDQGYLENRPPDGARLFIVGGVRAFAVGWRENVVQFSKLYAPQTPWEFCDDDAFRVFIPDPITALAWLDGVLVIFSASRVYIVTGDGPTDQGVGQYADPRELAVTVGADSEHIAEVPQGLIYKGAGTFWLLPRGLGPPEPIGDDVQETLARFPYLRAAVRASNGDDDVTHFTVAAADVPAAETKVLIWDNRLGSWSIDDIAAEVGAAGVVGGDFTWTLPSWQGTSGIPARQLNVNQYQDYTLSGTRAWIESRTTFGDWRPFGPLGWGQLHALQIHGHVSGVAMMNLDVTCGISGYTVQQQCTTVGQRYWEHAVKYPREGSFSFGIYDSFLTSYNGGIALHSVAYTHSDPEEGLRRMSNSERF